MDERSFIYVILLLCGKFISMNTSSSYCTYKILELNFTIGCCQNLNLSSVPQTLPLNIKELNLENNTLVEISKSNFQNYSKLEVLNIKRNNINAIENDTFLNLQHLRKLILSNNNISTFAPHLPKSLKELYIDDNPLQIIDVSKSELERFSVNSTKLQIFPELKLPFELIEADISDTDIVLSLSDIASLCSLQILKMNYQRMKSEPCIYQLIQWLNKHTINHNLSIFNVTDCYKSDMTTVDYHRRECMSRKNSRKCRVKYNTEEYCDCETLYLTKVPQHLYQNVTTLIMRNNEISQIDGLTFDNYKQLQTLDLTYNKITTIETHSFINLHNLKDLFLNFNRITIFDQTLTNLRGLELRENPLNNFTIYNSQIEELYLDNTRLTKVPKLPKNLRILNLSYNNITVIGVKSFKSLKMLNTIYFYFPVGITKPFTTCREKCYEFFNFIQKRNITLYKNWTC